MSWSGLPEQLESKIIPEPNSGCWIWTASCNTSGYGHVTYCGKLRTAHCVIYELLVAPVSEPLVLDHFHCDTRFCVNPQHVKPVTERENILRSPTTKAHQYAKRTHCKNGHLLDEANTYHPPGSHARICKKCRYIGSQKSIAKNREKHNAYHRIWMRGYYQRKKNKNG